jgi:hypothetical protein
VLDAGRHDLGQQLREARLRARRAAESRRLLEVVAPAEVERGRAGGQRVLQVERARLDPVARRPVARERDQSDAGLDRVGEVDPEAGPARERADVRLAPAGAELQLVARPPGGGEVRAVESRPLRFAIGRVGEVGAPPDAVGPERGVGARRRIAGAARGVELEAAVGARPERGEEEIRAEDLRVLELGQSRRAPAPALVPGGLARALGRGAAAVLPFLALEDVERQRVVVRRLPVELDLCDGELAVVGVAGRGADFDLVPGERTPEPEGVRAAARPLRRPRPRSARPRRRRADRAARSTGSTRRRARGRPQRRLRARSTRRPRPASAPSRATRSCRAW